MKAQTFFSIHYKEIPPFYELLAIFSLVVVEEEDCNEGEQELTRSRLIGILCYLILLTLSSITLNLKKKMAISFQQSSTHIVEIFNVKLHHVDSIYFLKK